MMELLVFLSVRPQFNLINFCAGYLLILFFFSTLEKREGRRRWLGHLCLALIVFLYFTPVALMEAGEVYSYFNLANQVLRLMLHWGAVCGYLWFAKRLRPSAALYLAAFYMNFYTAARTLSAITRYLLGLLSLSTEERAAWLVVLNFAVLLFEFGMAVLVRRCLPISGMGRVGPARLALVLMTNLLLVFFKYSALTLQSADAWQLRWGDVFLYPVFATGIVLAFLFLFESYQAAQERRQALEVERVARRYELHNAQHALEASDDLRRVYHDIKNHLLAIRALDRERQGVSEYVDTLLDDLSGYDRQVTTGLSAMDAFLSEKVRRAAGEGVTCSVCLDLSPLDFLSNADLIAIFGNAFDNALEAVRQLPEGEERLIFLKSSPFANTLLLRFTNRYAGELRRREGRLVTRKEEPELHGIGLKSISRAAQRYGGAVDTQVDEAAKTFTLTVLLPLPEEAGK